MNTTTRLSEMQKHRAMVAGEYLGEAILALSRYVSRLTRVLRTPAQAAAHTPR
jgi:hypothetical protein